MQQAIKNVELKKGEMVFNKKCYKGKQHNLEQHQLIPQYYDANQNIDFD